MIQVMPGDPPYRPQTSAHDNVRCRAVPDRNSLAKKPSETSFERDQLPKSTAVFCSANFVIER